MLNFQDRGHRPKNGGRGVTILRCEKKQKRRCQKIKQRARGGQKNFPEPTAPNAHRNSDVKSGAYDPALVPMLFKSNHDPVKAPGSCPQAEFCAPNGPSFEK